MRENALYSRPTARYRCASVTGQRDHGAIPAHRGRPERLPPPWGRQRCGLTGGQVAPQSVQCFGAVSWTEPCWLPGGSHGRMASWRQSLREVGAGSGAVAPSRDGGCPRRAPGCDAVPIESRQPSHQRPDRDRHVARGLPGLKRSFRRRDAEIDVEVARAMSVLLAWVQTTDTSLTMCHLGTPALVRERSRDIPGAPRAQFRCGIDCARVKGSKGASTSLIVWLGRSVVVLTRGL
jgi:hypothetical protein